MNIRHLVFLLALIAAFLFASNASAQCSMCKKVAEGKAKNIGYGSGGGGEAVKQASGVAKNLNNAILYLMAFPYIAFLIVVIWFRDRIAKGYYFITGWLFYRKGKSV